MVFAQGAIEIVSRLRQRLCIAHRHGHAGCHHPDTGKSRKAHENNTYNNLPGLRHVARSAVARAGEDSDTDRSHPVTFVKDSAITTAIKTKLAAEHITSLASDPLRCGWIHRRRSPPRAAKAKSVSAAARSTTARVPDDPLRERHGCLDCVPRIVTDPRHARN
jgi:hypothetical protein